jgi:general secretion pathway protein L
LIRKRLQHFFNWWITGLTYLLPVSIHNVINPPGDRITISVNGNRIVFRHYSDDSPERVNERSCLTENDDIEKTLIQEWLTEKLKAEPEIILLVADEKVLRKTIILPQAALENLREILGYEMERQTPFSVELVYFDYLVEKNGAGNDQLKVQLFASPKEHIDQMLKLLDSWNIGSNIIDVINPGINITTLNLLPAEKRKADNTKRANKLTLLLVVIAFCLFLAVLYVPLIKQNDLLSQLETEIDNSRDVVAKLKDLKLQKEALFDKTNFLISKRNDYVPVIDVLNELTRIIPDDTWLIRFSLTNGEIQLQGESAIASSMIQSIESSDILTDVKFRSPVVNNEATQKDKFNISAKLSDGKP